MDLSYFNPRAQSEADLLANFIARQSTLDFFLRQLRLTKVDRAANHYLVVAPRGYGKTSLLRRIAIAVRNESDLRQRFIPLSFREEQHNVISLDVFWRNCLQSLLEAREDEDAPKNEIDALDAAWDKYVPRKGLKREEQDGIPAWEEFRSHCERLQRRPLLLIDNLNSLLAGLEANQQWALRATLQRDDGPVLIAAASRYPESTNDRQAAFFDFFRIHTLDRLSDAEVMHCLRRMATRRGEAGRVVLDLLDRDPGRIVALNTLAGGNPRTLSVLYSVLESHLSTDILSQLSAMLDTFTGWYQARTEELPLQARAVFDALALNWDPISAARLAEITGLETTAVSSQLSRLEKAGYAEAVSLNRSGTGRNAYQVSERFFNIWYLMRNGPRRVQQSIQFLTKFLQSCFSAEERQSIAQRLLNNGGLEPGYAVALANCLPGGSLREQLIGHARMQASGNEGNEEYAATIQQLLNTVDCAGENDCQAMDESATELSLEEIDQLIERLSRKDGIDNAAILVTVLINRGNRLGELGRNEDAVAAYDTVVARFGDADEPVLREWVAKALVNKGNTLGELGRSEDAVAVYDDVVARFGDAGEPYLREPVARSLVSKGNTLGELGRSEDAVAAYDTVFVRFGDTDEPVLREWVAKALVNKGNTLGELGQDEDSVAVYDDVIARFGDSGEPALCEGVARSLVSKGNRLGELGRSEDAVATYDTVVARFGDADEPVLREWVAKALVNKGATLGELGRGEDAVASYDDVVAHFGDSGESALREPVAVALVNKGVTLGELDRSEDAVTAYDDVVARFGDAVEPALREWVAVAILNKGNLLLDFCGDPPGAVTAYEAGLSFNAPPGFQESFHASLAYALALHGGDTVKVREHVGAVLASSAISPAGRHLLGALAGVNEERWRRLEPFFTHIDLALQADDPKLWSNYLDDLQRLLWFVIARGDGEEFRRRMEEARYPQRYAPLYHAVVAALEGEDHLLKINPETRQMAVRIHAGIAHRIRRAALRGLSGHSGQPSAP